MAGIPETGYEASQAALDQAPGSPSGLSTQKKRLLVIGGLAITVGLSVAGAFFILESDPDLVTSLFAESAPKDSLPAVTPPASDTLATSSETQELAEEDTDEPEDVELSETSEVNSDSQAQPLTAESLKDMPHRNDPIIDALELIEQWKSSKETLDKTVLNQYLYHEKLWVRLGAMEVAIDSGAAEQSYLKSAGIDIQKNHSHSQILRYLTRFKNKGAKFNQNLALVLNM